MAADRYEQNDQFFRKLFDDPDMMKQVMETVGSVPVSYTHLDVYKRQHQATSES